MVYTESQKKATTKYLKNLKEIRFRVKPDDFERYQKAAKEMGYSSMRQFYLDAIEEKISKKL